MLDFRSHALLAIGGMREHTISFLCFTAADVVDEAIPAPIGSEDEPTLPIHIQPLRRQA